jgi:hypothetical protein
LDLLHRIDKKIHLSQMRLRPYEGRRQRYIEFADRMIRAVHGKSIFSSKAATTDFEDLVMPSQEAFTPLSTEMDIRIGYRCTTQVL